MHIHNLTKILLGVAFIFLFRATAFSWTAGPTGWWCDYDGKCYYGDTSSGGGGGTWDGGSPGQSFDPIAERQNEAVRLNNLAVQYEKQGDLEKAVQTYDQAYSQDSGNEVIGKNFNSAVARLANMIGLVAYEETRWGDAVNYFQQAATRRPDIPQYADNLRKAQEQVRLAWQGLENPPIPVVPEPQVPPVNPMPEIVFYIPKEIDVSLIEVAEGVEFPERARTVLTRSLPDRIKERYAESNPQAELIMQSFKTREVPSPIKKYDDLNTGDIILVAPDKTKFFDGAVSHTIQFLDRLGSFKWDSPASHTAIYLGNWDNERWFMDHTAKGTIIMPEHEFFKVYGMRQLQVGAVAQPLSKEEASKLRAAAEEMQTYSHHKGIRAIFDKTNYGIIGKDNLVCSEAARWVLIKAGRDIPEGNAVKKYGAGVNFSPADFYDMQEYFLITPLSMTRKKP